MLDKEGIYNLLLYRPMTSLAFFFFFFISSSPSVNKFFQCLHHTQEVETPLDLNEAAVLQHTIKVHKVKSLRGLQL